MAGGHICFIYYLCTAAALHDMALFLYAGNIAGNLAPLASGRARTSTHLHTRSSLLIRHALLDIRRNESDERKVVMEGVRLVEGGNKHEQTISGTALLRSGVSANWRQRHVFDIGVMLLGMYGTR